MQTFKGDPYAPGQIHHLPRGLRVPKDPGHVDVEVVAPFPEKVMAIPTEEVDAGGDEGREDGASDEERRKETARW